ncbi:hypothetical protein ZOSMA_1G01620 [Zostera marina]|uniref:Uncharacterized protein n=1 Tax=Zostera marina TaxID=29655 RepID=A0A0K9PPP3_ZOSMR|nr:hypothetical protein ZOSMA_1G01620 [Zostera marina]
MASSISLTVIPVLNPRIPNHCRCRLPKLSFPFLRRSLPSLSIVRPCLVTATKKNATPEMSNIEAERRSESSMPDAFRELNVEVPDKPVRWPWLIPVVFIVYGWRATLWELNNWKNASIGIVYFFRNSVISIGKFLCYSMGDRIDYFLDQLFLFLPVSEITTFILLTSAAVSVAEATSPNSVNEQRYLFTVASFVGFGYNLGILSNVILCLIPVCFFLFSKFINKKNAVSAALPCVALLFSASIPWLFFKPFVMVAYSGLATYHHFHLSRSATIDSAVESVDSLPNGGTKLLPWTVFLAGLSIGIFKGFTWLRFRHLTWMVV